MSATETSTMPDDAPVPRSALGPALTDQGYYVGQVERNLYWVTDGVDPPRPRLRLVGAPLMAGSPISWVALAVELQRGWAREEPVADFIEIVPTERLLKE